MRLFRQRARPETSAPKQPVCQRCHLPFPADGRAVKAWSILDGAEPALFHVECAPEPDSLRWRSHREMPVRVVREESPGE